MKLNGIIGKGTGKLGSSVFAISGGEQVVREYNPVVSNPNTDAQVAQRAKLKLMSQLAAALAPALGFAKMGLVSARNQFVSKNIGLAEFAENRASVPVEDLQLTPSNVYFSPLNVTSAAGGISVALMNAAAGDIKRVVYFVFEQTLADQLKYVASKIVTEAGAGRTFASTFEVGGGAYVVYAYGVKDESANATMRYENYVNVAAGEDATLDVVSMFRYAGYALTKSVAGMITLH